MPYDFHKTNKNVMPDGISNPCRIFEEAVYLFVYLFIHSFSHQFFRPYGRPFIQPSINRFNYLFT